MAHRPGAGDVNDAFRDIAGVDVPVLDQNISPADDERRWVTISEKFLSEQDAASSIPEIQLSKRLSERLSEKYKAVRGGGGW